MVSLKTGHYPIIALLAPASYYIPIVFPRALGGGWGMNIPVTEEQSANLDCTLKKELCPTGGKTWNDAKGDPEVAVPLLALPPGVDFPDSFPYPIAYEPQTKTLRFRGTMYHGTYVYLLALSSNAAYARAIEQLFVVSSLPPSRSRGSASWIISLVAGVLVVVGATLAAYVGFSVSPRNGKKT